jgi:amino acid adenylation domain-containing protein
MGTTLYAGNQWRPRAGPDSLAETLENWAGSLTEYPRHESIPGLFRQIALAQPDRAALVQGSYVISYRDLNDASDRLASDLQRFGVALESRVGLVRGRSLDAIVALLGILKAGAAYVPFEPDLPPARLNVLLEIAAPHLVLRGASVTSSEVLADRQTDGHSQASGNSLAYVMFTSGSTGRPKGVMVEHHSIVRLVRNTNYCDFGPRQVFLQAAPLSFDASTFEIWGALLNGGTLVLVDSERPSIDDLARTIRDHQVTTVWFTAPLFNLMIEQHARDLQSVQQLLTGGEVVSPPHVRMAREALPECTIVNGYGPTENTTFTCFHRVPPGGVVLDPLPIGRPVANTRVYLLDESGQPVGPGEAGELCAAGEGVARGYLNDAALTTERFVPDPFGVPGQRMYRTGDIARWRPDGALDFLGRRDDQVKILGHRVEPAEVAGCLQTHPEIQTAYVLVVQATEKTKRLVAYYQARKQLNPLELRSFVRERLPEYMTPQSFVQVAEMPLNRNGKVDRDALRSLGHASQTGERVQQGRGFTEQVRAVWCEVLKSEHIGLDENFFDVGGDSLLLMSVHSRLQNQLGLKIPIMELFEFTTIRQLAGRVEKLRPSTTPATEEPSEGSADLISRRRAALRRRAGERS